jgi:hypothetical protein
VSNLTRVVTRQVTQMRHLLLAAEIRQIFDCCRRERLLAENLVNGRERAHEADAAWCLPNIVFDAGRRRGAAVGRRHK